MTSKLMKRRNTEAFTAQLPEIRQEGFTVEVKDKIIRHYRLMAPNGRKIDFWATTHTWMEIGQEDRGKGIESMLKHLKEIRDGEPAPAQRAPGGEAYPMVTLFADASYDDQHKAAGWGAWMIRTGGQSQTAGGPFLGNIQSSYVAECWAICSALRHAVEHEVVRSGDTVMIQSDCKASLDGLLLLIPTAKDKPHRDGISLNLPKKIGTVAAKVPLTEVAETVARLGLNLSLRHVKGHTAGGGRNWVNNAVDKIAKEHMKKVRSIRMRSAS